MMPGSNNTTSWVSNCSYANNSCPEMDVNSKNWIDFLGYIAVPTILIVGVCGNTLTLIVMRTKQYRVMPFSFVLTALSVSDTTLILLLPFNKLFVRELFGYDARALSDMGCKAFFCFFRTAKMTSSWFVVFLACERFLVVWFPLRIKQLSTKRHALIYVFVVYTVMFSLNGTWTFASKIVNGVCLPHKPDADLIEMGRSFVLSGTILYFYLPALILVIVTPLTVYEVIKQYRYRLKLTKCQTQNSEELLRITIMLIGVTIAYVVMVAPIATAHNIAYFKDIRIFESKDPTMVVFRELAQLAEQLNYAINFFLYVICNKTFRNHCLVILRCRSITERKGAIKTEQVSFTETSRFDSVASSTVTETKS